jgi:hypothetical protein
VVTNRYEIEGYRFGVRSTSHAYAEWLDDVMAAYRSPAQPDDDPLDATYSIVVEDGSRGADRAGKRFHILYLGGWDIVRTLDISRLAEATMWEMESIRFPVRDDAAFVEAGLIGLGEATCVVASSLIPGLNRSKRRGERFGVRSPGGVSFAVDLATGELIDPERQLDAPRDALDRLAEHLPVAPRTEPALVSSPCRLNGVFQGGDEPGVLTPDSRASTLQNLLPAVRNLSVIGGAGVRAVGQMLLSARAVRGGYASTNDLYEVLGRFGDELRTTA